LPDSFGSRSAQARAGDRREHLDRRHVGDTAGDFSLDPVNLGLQRGELATCTQEDHAIRRRPRSHALLDEPASHVALAREHLAVTPQHVLGLIDRASARGRRARQVHQAADLARGLGQ